MRSARLPCAVVIIAFACGATPTRLGAQNNSAATLLKARNALSDLRYAEADSLARMALRLGDSTGSGQRILALQITAAARYPADTSYQRADSALAALSELVRLGHLAPIPPELSWPGLDSLFARAGGTLPSASVLQSGTSALRFSTSGDTTPTQLQTSQWFKERLAQFAGLTYQDSGEVAVQAAAERVYGVDVQGCALQYKVRRWSEDLVLERGRAAERANERRTDSSFSVDLRSLDTAGIQLGATDIAARFNLPGALPMRIVYLRAYPRGAGPNDMELRRLDLAFMRKDQAQSVLAALRHLILLCQRAPL